ncbi:Uncharacterized protein HZ326_26399 [Fusarium oxysporum f. sp. albedinis]|nr:Uncharacterized protein HZ326_26399 [Fusarium oxysporum f. sp. albedinis]
MRARALPSTRSCPKTSDPTLPPTPGPSSTGNSPTKAMMSGRPSPRQLPIAAKASSSLPGTMHGHPYCLQTPTQTLQTAPCPWAQASWAQTSAHHATPT